MNNPEIKLTLRLSDLNIVLAGLGEVAAKHSHEVILAIKRQAGPQMREANERLRQVRSAAQVDAGPGTSSNPPAPTPDAPARTATSEQEQHHDP